MLLICSGPVHGGCRRGALCDGVGARLPVRGERSNAAVAASDICTSLSAMLLSTTSQAASRTRLSLTDIFKAAFRHNDCVCSTGCWAHCATSCRMSHSWCAPGLHQTVRPLCSCCSRLEFLLLLQSHACSLNAQGTPPCLSCCTRRSRRRPRPVCKTT